MRVLFGPFALDTERRLLSRDGDPVHLSPKAYELLTLLVERRPRAVSKAEIHDRLWPSTYVTEASLMTLVAELRVALGEAGRAPRFVRNVRGYGYAFADDAHIDDAPVTATREGVAAATMWVECGAHRFPLAHGENVIGRDARVHVALDDVSVSRRHARLVVDGASARLEDLGSRNGTYARNERLVGPLEMRDGLAFRVGAITLIFRTLAAPGSTAVVAAGDAVRLGIPGPVDTEVGQ
jgi:DNA-binding winged helix-turn-helix (wHTH) protein